jgi:hypothetical protein
MVNFSVSTETDLHTALTELPEEALVGVSEHPSYPGCLVFQPHPSITQKFYSEHSDWLSRYLTLSDLFMLGPFVELLQAEGFQPIFMNSCADILDAHNRWSEPLDIAGFTCPGDGELFNFQTFGLRRALERADGARPADRLFFANWAAGAGKSLFACAGAQELANRDLVDLVVVLTISPQKINLLRFFENTTKLDAVMIEHGTPAKRHAKYAAMAPHAGAVLVTNYERVRVDEKAFTALTRGKRVLWVLDEVQKVLTDDKRTLTRKAFDRVVAGCDPTIWAMSASVVKASPLRWRDVWSLDGHPRLNPLGTRADFERRYVQSRSYMRVPTRYGGSIEIEKIHWHNARLHEVRHRVADRVHSVRKTDPSVRHLFKGMTSLITPVQMSPEDGRLYDAVITRAEQANDNGEGDLAGYALLLQHVCNNPLALRRTEVEFGAVLVEKYPKLITSAHSAKVAMVVEQLEAIKDAGDKVVLFTQWVRTSLELIADELARRNISYVAHHGGMARTTAQLAIDQFRSDPSITTFLSSDAGAFGLNLPEARYIINWEPSHSWDIMMQRSERINRADSQLEGLTAYTMVTDDSIEGRIMQVCEERRLLAASTLGTSEVLNTDETPPDMRWLIFG